VLITIDNFLFVESNDAIVQLFVSIVHFIHLIHLAFVKIFMAVVISFCFIILVKSHAAVVRLQTPLCLKKQATVNP
jgi:hypothetical protein